MEKMQAITVNHVTRYVLLNSLIDFRRNAISGMKTDKK